MGPHQGLTQTTIGHTMGANRILLEIWGARFLIIQETPLALKYELQSYLLLLLSYLCLSSWSNRHTTKPYAKIKRKYTAEPTTDRNTVQSCAVWTLRGPTHLCVPHSAPPSLGSPPLVGQKGSQSQLLGLGWVGELVRGWSGVCICKIRRGSRGV